MISPSNRFNILEKLLSAFCFVFSPMNFSIFILFYSFHLSITREERDRDYYNDMPGKVPPDVGPPPVPPLPNLNRNISPEPRGEFLVNAL